MPRHSVGVPSTADLVALLDRLLEPGSQEVVEAPDILRLTLALDPPPTEDVGDADAVLLHRSYGFAPPPGVGVVACHDPFDRALGLAHNAFLHEELGLTGGEDLAPKLTVHDAPPGTAGRVAEAFGGLERRHEGAAGHERRVVLADAMNAELVETAARAGAGLYVTGTWRVPGAAAVEQTGIGVLAVGHARQERASLTRLARLLVQHGFPAHVRMR